MTRDQRDQRDQREQSARMAAQAVLADANPVPADAVAESWRDPAGRAAFEAIVRTPPDEKAGRMRPRPRLWPRRPRTRLVIGTAIVAASVAAGLVISGLPSQLLGSTGTSNQPTDTAPMLHYVLTGVRQPVAVRQLPPARSVLLRLARAAEHQAPITQPAGARISYVVTNEWYMGTAVAGGTSSSVVTPEVDHTWTGPHGSWRDLAHYGRPLVLGGSKETLQSLEGRQPVSDDHGGPNYSNTGPLPGTFSLNPTVLERQLLNAPPEKGGANNAYHLFEIITDLHHQIVPPRLDAAMWRVLAARSDVRYLGRVTDRAGGLAMRSPIPTGPARNGRC